MKAAKDQVREGGAIVLFASELTVVYTVEDHEYTKERQMFERMYPTVLVYQNGQVLGHNAYEYREFESQHEDSKGWEQNSNGTWYESCGFSTTGSLYRRRKSLLAQYDLEVGGFYYNGHELLRVASETATGIMIKAYDTEGGSYIKKAGALLHRRKDWRLLDADDPLINRYLEPCILRDNGLEKGKFYYRKEHKLVEVLEVRGNAIIVCWHTIGGSPTVQALGRQTDLLTHRSMWMCLPREDLTVEAFFKKPMAVGFYLKNDNACLLEVISNTHFIQHSISGWASGEMPISKNCFTDYKWTRADDPKVRKYLDAKLPEGWKQQGDLILIPIHWAYGMPVLVVGKDTQLSTARGQRVVFGSKILRVCGYATETGRCDFVMCENHTAKYVITKEVK